MIHPIFAHSRFHGLVFVLLVVLSTLYMQAADDFRTLVEDRDPMSLEGVDPEVAAVLEKYYAASFGGAANWDAVKDFRFEGVLEMPVGEFNFFGYLKKPDYSKIILYGEGASQMVMSYDGADAWQIIPPVREAVDIPALAAVDFIRDAPAGGLLLYPNLPGKRIEALGTRLIGDYRCRDLRVTLPGGQQVTYAIDLNTGLERQKIATNSVSGQVETLTHRRWEAHQGMVILSESIMTAGGKALYTSRIENVEVNAGLVPAMFERPPNVSSGSSSSRLELNGPFKMPGLQLEAEEPESPFALPDSMGLPAK